MKNYLSYGVGAIGSICIHGLVLSVLLIPGDGDTQAIVIQPQYINSKLVELAPKKKVVVPKKTKSDAAKKKRERQRRLDAAKAKANADAQKKKKADLDRKEKERLALEQDRLERERLAELQRQKLAAEFAQTLAEEQLLLRAQEDEVAANSYRQLISLRLSENWSRPPSARRGMETLIRLQLVPTGRVVGVTVLKSSGDSAFDRSVEQAAFKAAQFIELQQMSPSLFEKKFRQVDVSFSPQDLRL
jgi:colicin import membrane protein|tara:strand:+ start:465 stop:1199 length:735 start_codon:yes stop_codon:yes gene_type:complete